MEHILCLQCEMMVNKLTTSNYIYNKQNSCLTSELGQHLLTPDHTYTDVNSHEIICVR